MTAVAHVVLWADHVPCVCREKGFEVSSSQSTIEVIKERAGEVAATAESGISQAVEQLREAVTPAVEAARANLVTEVIPKVTASVAAVAAEAAQAAQQAAATAADGAAEAAANASAFVARSEQTSARKGRALWWVLGITGVTAAAVAIYRKTRPPAEDPWATPAPSVDERLADEAVTVNEAEAVEEPEAAASAAAAGEGVASEGVAEPAPTRAEDGSEDGGSEDGGSAQER